MKLLTDVHVHTVVSGHAYSTFDENARWAKDNGIKVMGIADHTDGIPGGASYLHFINMKVLPREVYGVKILRGMELNILDYNGSVDYGEEILKRVDYTIASYHPPCIEPTTDAKLATRGMIMAMENPYVTIIGHPGDNRYPLDYEEVVLASKRTGTVLEVNNASLRSVSMRQGVRDSLIEILKYCNKHDVPVMANTDAHLCYDVGKFDDTVKLFEEISFPEELILNLYPDKVIELLSSTDK
ncbi:MAG: phosphatase [Epulopiscium sp. Nele67-Bin004]|nr:MAG: phosphatase [Epulopiscium sp. Nele67-Bin004]